jgi:hypothetical protein
MAIRPALVEIESTLVDSPIQQLTGCNRHAQEQKTDVIQRLKKRSITPAYSAIGPPLKALRLFNLPTT